jgi:hypothetical protein
MTSRIIGFDSSRARLKKYSATATSGAGGKAIVRIEIEVTGHWELGDIVHQLQTIEAEQKAEAPRGTGRAASGGARK